MLTKMQKKPKKGPLSHQKIKCSFLDYIQLLMIGQAIWAKNVNWKAIKQKSPPKSSKNKMFIFGLCSTSDDRLSDPSRKCQLTKMLKKWKRPPKSSKNKIFVFGLLFNFWWSAERSEQKTSTKMQKNEKGPLSHQKIKCLFLDYVQLLMIEQAIWEKNVNWNVKKQKNPLSHQKIKCSFLDYVQLLMIGWTIWAKNIDLKKNPKKAP